MAQFEVNVRPSELQLLSPDTDRDKMDQLFVAVKFEPVSSRRQIQKCSQELQLSWHMEDQVRLVMKCKILPSPYSRGTFAPMIQAISEVPMDVSSCAGAWSAVNMNIKVW